MPSPFLKDRHAKLFREVAGNETVAYVPYESGHEDDLTREVADEAAAYSADPVTLPALVDFSPSEGMRKKIGLEIIFQAVLRITKADIDANGITLKHGDQFTLPDTRKVFVKKVFQDKQAGGEFLEYIVAVGSKVGRRG